MSSPESGALEAPAGKLPSYFGPLVGRRREQRLLRRLLADPHVRLLTLTGPGGVGKTRLAVEVAHRLVDAFGGGLFFADLTTVHEPALVLPAVVQAVGLGATGKRAPLQQLAANLDRRGPALLVVDNFEQVLSATGDVLQLLEVCSDLKVLVTSRELLRVPGEHEVRLPPLPVPELARLRPTAVDLVAALAEQEAVALFLQRARLVQPGYLPDREEIVAIVHICQHLDGLPLALELAAARLRLFSAQALLKRIESYAGHSLPLLTDDRPGRHQGLWQTIQWSYELLLEDERQLFASLAVFEGSFSLEAAEQIVGGAQSSAEPWSRTAAGIASLVEKSLVRAERNGEEARFALLATIREFAQGQLSPAHAVALGAVHAAYYLRLAEQAAPHLAGAEQMAWLERLKRAYPNLRAALLWAIAAGEQEMMLRLAGAFWRFWLIGRYRSEGSRLLERVLAATAEVEAASLQQQRGHVLCGAAMIAHRLADQERALPLAEAAVTTFRASGDRQGLASALGYQGRVLAGMGKVAAARPLLAEAERLHRAQGNRPELARALHGLARAALVLGDYEQARAAVSEALTIYREQRDLWGVASQLFLFGSIAYMEGDSTAATLYAREMEELLASSPAREWQSHALGLQALVALDEGKLDRAEGCLQAVLARVDEGSDRRATALLRIGLGDLARQRGELEQARRELRRGLASALASRDPFSTTSSLELLAQTAAATNDFTAAAHYLGAAASLRHTIAMPVPPRAQKAVEELLGRVQEGLEHEAFARAWQLGPKLHLPPDSLPWQAAPLPERQIQPLDLTPREVDVLRLVAQGLTDKEVAAELVVSPRTVQGHLRNVYGKLGVNTRTAASLIAIEAGLVVL